jgi:hypothetical protein
MGLGTVSKDGKAFKQRFATRKKELTELVGKQEIEGDYKAASNVQKELARLINIYNEYEFMLAKGVAHEVAFQMIVCRENGEENVAATMVGLLRYLALLMSIVAATQGNTLTRGDDSEAGKAENKKCYKCGKKGHLSRNCKERPSGGPY